MPLPPLTQFERPAIDYTALEDAIAFAEQAAQRTRRRSLVALQDEGGRPVADRGPDPAHAAPEPAAGDA